MIKCICRQCQKQYDPKKSRADFTGYCSQKCMHAKAKDLGFKKSLGNSCWQTLKNAGELGNQPVPLPPLPPSAMQAMDAALDDSPQGEITIDEVKQIIKEEGNKIFSVKFTKRSTGEERLMVCRTGVTSRLKGGEKAYDAEAHGLITVFDMASNDYRSISTEGVFAFKFNGNPWVKVIHPVKKGKNK